MRRRLQGGVYALIIHMPADGRIRIGQLGRIFFIAGVYVYIGSALNSLEARVSRHFQKSKRKHWHVDFLLARPDVKLLSAGTRRTTRHLECTMSRAVQARADYSIDHFGCSDCSCTSHLHYLGTPARALRVIEKSGFRVLHEKPDIATRVY